eukprot:340013-Pleurochrysis_carterae.AAC.1
MSGRPAVPPTRRNASRREMRVSMSTRVSEAANAPATRTVHGIMRARMETKTHRQSEMERIWKNAMDSADAISKKR